MTDEEVIGGRNKELTWIHWKPYEEMYTNPERWLLPLGWWEINWEFQGEKV